ncbi:MAG: hypothetical protein KF865_14900 [Bdellovibrionaceae bacterium]|nr:hypothetical protein [Pseudobdellovibrionaceae bacterium]
MLESLLLVNKQLKVYFDLEVVMKLLRYMLTLVFSLIAFPSYGDVCQTEKDLIQASVDSCYDTPIGPCDSIDDIVNTTYIRCWAEYPNPQEVNIWTIMHECVCSGPPGGPYDCSSQDLKGPWISVKGPMSCEQSRWKDPSYTDPKRPIRSCGSIIQADNQVLGEALPIAGTSFSLNYFSDRVVGRKTKSEIAVVVAGVSGGSDNISNQVEIRDSVGALVASSGTLTNSSGQSYIYNPSISGWGSQSYVVAVKESYPAYTFEALSHARVGGLNVLLLGVGGWFPSNWYYYDVAAKTLYQGNGVQRRISALALSGEYAIAEEDGSFVYYFDSDGKHLRTKTGLTGETILSFAYNVSKQLISITEPFGRITTFNRNISGQLISITAPKGQVTSIVVDGDGYLTSLTNPQNETYEFTYWSSEGLLKTFEKPTGPISTFYYDVDGHLTKDQHSGGFFWDLVKTADTLSSATREIESRMGRRTSIVNTANDYSSYKSQVTTYPDGSQRTTDDYGTTENDTHAGFTYGFTTQESARFGASARDTTSETVNYSSVLRVTSHVNSVTLSNPNDFFSISNLSRVSTSGTTEISSDYDPVNHIWSAQSKLGQTASLGLDAYERPTSFQRGNLTAINYTYTNENLTGITQGARSTSFSYNPTSGVLSSVTNSLSQTTGFAYDSAERLIGIVLPDLRAISYGYDATGNLVSVTPSSRPSHAFGFNSSELISSYAPPALLGVPAVATSYTYNNDKQLTEITRPDSQAIEITYDGTTGQMTSMITPDGTSSFTFMPGYRMPSSIVSASGFTNDFQMSGPDIYSQQVTEQSTSSLLWTFSHNLSSQGLKSNDLVQVQSDMSQVSYFYDDDERMTKAGNLNLTYDTPNSLLTCTTQGLASDAFTYNSFGEMLTYEAKHASVVLFSETLTRDDLGRILTKTQTIDGEGTSVDEYTYDSSGRLTQTERNSVVVATYVYDSNNNRNSGTIGGVVTSATYDDQDRMTQYNVYDYTYNANGELQTKTNSLTSAQTQYVYDVLGNLKEVTLPSTDVITYEIDGMNRRIGKLVNGNLVKRYAYMDGLRLVAEIKPDGSLLRRYVYASKSNVPDYFIQEGVRYRIFSDHLGSPRVVVNTITGAVMQKMNHDEFGRVVLDTNPGYTPFGFAGGIYDHQTGLVRFGARDYDPETGRWTSKDPILFDGGDTNLYGYVANDPVNWVDPDGLKRNFVFQGGNLSFYDSNGSLLFEGPASSGPWGRGALPQGNYSVGGMRDNRAGSYSCSGSGGYSLDLHPQFSTNRTDLRIHPDGGTPGTLGCIGVKCGNGAADTLGEILRGVYNQPMTPWIGLEVR